MLQELPQRYQDILKILVSDYISTAGPVGSRAIAKRHPTSLSPATIRNVMADLTELGLLSQPYTSAGRVPTSSGLNYYVQTLLSVADLSEHEKSNIQNTFSQENSSEEKLLKQSSSILSEFSSFAGLVVMPSLSHIRFKHIEFLQLTDARLLGIFVAQSGMVQNAIIEVQEQYSFRQLEKINNFCNRIFIGLTLQEAKEKIARELKCEREEYDALLLKGFQYSNVLFQSIPDQEVHIKGTDNLCQQAEAREFEKIKALLSSLNEKEKMLSLLERCEDAHGVKIFVGSDHEHQEQIDASVVSAPYSKNGKIIGALGVIGPRRMNYAHIVSVVHFTSQLVSRYLEQKEL
ncbi:MAG: heat-inducible transcription repressor HrcA [Deltaproteobacteria bacterium CG_4_10_14_0_2_um_filter_43_8]|nr:MAG: heat-inducible transcription repressor HrcA [Deltaproteobacteria bacterium CG11_big_fil_rev_8_21_14_0_20_42_23]PJA20660.1 MAG: heat-inducible transcription repressor HrcA [Deltaproteobacteria bacterium CG_4_10_14_0_2_um_filter_43_8]PJC65090.1 MAG: heat-inducible transcription repressor HrcA [Deltaproteobacteria bacterium CG_4_9_14_0_2_um_filter_42_21]